MAWLLAGVILALGFVLQPSALAQDLDAIERDIGLLPPDCINSETYGDNIAFTTNGSTIDFYCATQFITDEDVFDSLVGFNISDSNFTCDTYWWARFPDTGQCLFATGLPGISCRRWTRSPFSRGGENGYIYRTILTVNVTEDLDRVTFLCNQGQRLGTGFITYNHSSLLVESIPETQPDLLPTQIITGITVGSALLCLLFVQGVVLLYSSPDF